MYICTYIHLIFISFFFQELVLQQEKKKDDCKEKVDILLEKYFNYIKDLAYDGELRTKRFTVELRPVDR